MNHLPVLDWQRLTVAAIASVVAAIGGIDGGFFLTKFVLGVAPVLAISIWVAVRPASSGWFDGMVAAGVAGFGPAIGLGLWWYWWSDFCIFQCEGVSREPMAFVPWFTGALVAALATGALAGHLGKRMRHAKAAAN